MATPSSGPISIQSLKNEWTQWAGYNDLASWEQLVLGRAAGAQVSLSEFYGRSNEAKYGPYYMGPTAGSLWEQWYTIPTKYGNVDIIHTQQVGPTTLYWFYSAGNPTAWNNFKRVERSDGVVMVLNTHFVNSPSQGYLYAASAVQGESQMYWVFQ